MKNTDSQILQESLKYALTCTGGTAREVINFMAGYLENRMPDIALILDEIIRCTAEADNLHENELVFKTVDRVMKMQNHIYE